MKWVSIFKYLSIEYGENIAFALNQTQRVSFVSNVDGDRVRIRFTNRYGRNELRIDGATIGKEKSPYLSDIEQITFGGKRSIVLAPGEELFCDEIKMDIWAGDRIAISLYFAGRQHIDSICCFWADGGAKVKWQLGNTLDGSLDMEAPLAVTAPFIKDDPNFHMMKMFMGFDAVQVMAEDEVKVVAAFGDSITHMSFYTNALYRRLCDNAFERVSLINCGIGGNRLVSDATVAADIGKELVLFGKAGVTRFERDVFELDEVDTVLVLIGINDIMHPLQLEGKDKSTPARDIIEGYKKITACAHENGAEVFFGTIMPCGNDDYPKEWLTEFDEVRNEVNSWIRKGEMIDGYFDFDKELRDGGRSGFMEKKYHIGDGLHPGTLGGERMADLVDIKTILGK